MANKKASKKPTKKSTISDGRLRSTRERLQTSVLEELWSIWRADPRVPSVRSRHSWAIARNANPRLVDHWFLRRKACAKKLGQPILDDPYDIPLGRSEPPNVPKREHSATPIILGFDDAFPDLPSDDTLVHPAGVACSNDLDASSDTAFDECMLMESKIHETLAYNEHLRHHQYSQRESRFDAIIFPFTIDLAISSADLDTFKDRYNDSFPVCNQGQGKQSGFMCVLCPLESAQGVQGTPDMAPSDSHALFDSKEDPFIACPRLDFFSTTLSELSAIPFLFRTPPAVAPDSAVNCRNANDWTIVEEELSRLVHDGELDFSFLDVPHLSSMELID